MTDPTYRNLFNAPPERRREMILQGVVEVFEAAAPGRFRALYVLGSTADASATDLSDIDACVFLHDETTESEFERIQHVAEALRRISPVRLDLEICTRDRGCFRSGSPDVRLKLGGALVAGEDLTDTLAMPSRDAYREWMHEWPEEFIGVMHDGSDPQRLAYPDPSDEFFGYTRKRASNWYPSDVEAGTKELVAAVCWIASAILVENTSAYVVTRRQCVEEYRALVGDQWADYVEDVYRLCKLEWQYRVPNDAASRRRLRTLCGTFLDFCNHYRQSFARAGSA